MTVHAATPDPTRTLDPLLSDTCTRLTPSPDLGGALVALLLDDAGPATTLLAACLYAVHTAPGMADHLDHAVDAVATTAADVQRGYRQDHEAPCSYGRLNGECDECADILASLHEDAVRELLYLLTDRAVADLLSVAGVSAERAA